MSSIVAERLFESRPNDCAMCIAIETDERPGIDYRNLDEQLQHMENIDEELKTTTDKMQHTITTRLSELPLLHPTHKSTKEESQLRMTNRRACGSHLFVPAIPRGPSGNQQAEAGTPKALTPPMTRGANGSQRAAASDPASTGTTAPERSEAPERRKRVKE